MQKWQHPLSKAGNYVSASDVVVSILRDTGRNLRHKGVAYLALELGRVVFRVAEDRENLFMKL